jgi:tRNA threonylcarbamoyladenosine biosynthesis protein TsaB
VTEIYILNIETTTKNCSVSVSKYGELLACNEIAESGYSHAEKLHLFIEDCIKEAGISFQDLNAVAVSKGPGSYTGLRIGVSAAKGLCYALEIPLIATDTLSCLAQQVTQNDGIIIPMIDARRMEVYSAIFNSKKVKIREVEAEILTEESFANFDETVYFVGDCNEKAKTVLTKSNFVFLDEIVYPSAREMGVVSYEKFIASQFENVAYFEPYYLKDFLMVK